MSKKMCNTNVKIFSVSRMRDFFYHIPFTVEVQDYSCRGTSEGSVGVSHPATRTQDRGTVGGDWRMVAECWRWKSAGQGVKSDRLNEFAQFGEEENKLAEAGRRIFLAIDVYSKTIIYCSIKENVWLHTITLGEKCNSLEYWIGWEY